MTTVQISLPDQLVQEAESAGLLSPQSIEGLIRQQLRSQAADRLAEAIRQMDQFYSPEPMTPEAVAQEIAVMRAERRTAQS